MRIVPYEYRENTTAAFCYVESVMGNDVRARAADDHEIVHWRSITG